MILALEIKKRNNILINNCSKKNNRAVHIIALFFIFLTNILFAQINSLDTKCLWISREDMISKESVDSALLFAHKSGFDKVFLQVRGRGDAFYNSKIVNKSNLIDSKFDPLKYSIELGKKLDLEVHVWFNCYILWSGNSYPEDVDHILNTNPLWTEVDLYGKSDSSIDLNIAKSPSWEGIYLSPMSQEVNQYLREVIQELYEKYDIDGIHLDYIRYQDEYYGFHRDGRKEFNLLFDIDPLDISRGVISPRYGWDQNFSDSLKMEWVKFKQGKITELLEFINEDIDLLNREIIISTAVKPNLIDAKIRWHQDWQDWIERGLVDFVVPMNYSSDLVSYMTNIKIMKDNISEDYIGKIIMGISVYNQTAESAIDKIFLARLNGFTGISIFSYGVHRNNLDWFDPFLDSWKEP